MKLTLKNLVDNNILPAKHRFLTPLKEVLVKEFGKKVVESPEINTSILHEMMNKLVEKGNKFVYFITPEEFKFLESYRSNNNTAKKGEKFSFENSEVVFSRTREVMTEFELRKTWRYSSGTAVNSSTVFVVTDIKGFEEYALGLLIKEEEAEKKRITEREEKRRKDATELRLLVAKYELKGTISEKNKSKIKFLESLENGTPAEKYKALCGFESDIDSCDCDECCGW